MGGTKNLKTPLSNIKMVPYLMQKLNIYVLSMTKVFYFKKRAANIFAKPHLGDLKLDTIFQLANRFRAKVYSAKC